MASTSIRSATPLDLDKLAVLEVQAGEVFHVVGMSEVADDVPDGRPWIGVKHKG